MPRDEDAHYRAQDEVPHDAHYKTSNFDLYLAGKIHRQSTNTQLDLTLHADRGSFLYECKIMFKDVWTIRRWTSDKELYRVPGFRGSGYHYRDRWWGPFSRRWREELKCRLRAPFCYRLGLEIRGDDFSIWRDFNLSKIFEQDLLENQRKFIEFVQSEDEAAIAQMLKEEDAFFNPTGMVIKQKIANAKHVRNQPQYHCVIKKQLLEFYDITDSQKIDDNTTYKSSYQWARGLIHYVSNFKNPELIDKMCSIGAIAGYLVTHPEVCRRIYGYTAENVDRVYLDECCTKLPPEQSLPVLQFSLKRYKTEQHNKRLLQFMENIIHHNLHYAPDYIPSVDNMEADFPKLPLEYETFLLDFLDLELPAADLVDLEPGIKRYQSLKNENKNKIAPLQTSEPVKEAVSVRPRWRICC